MDLKTIAQISYGVISTGFFIWFVKWSIKRMTEEMTNQLKKVTETLDEHLKEDKKEKKEILELIDKLKNDLFEKHIMRLEKDVAQIKTALKAKDITL